MPTKTDKMVVQAGVIPYRISRGSMQVLLITSSSGNWIVPKGNIEQDLTPQSSAAQEAIEEAGAVGRVRPVVVGSFRTRKNGRSCRVDLYSMKVARLLPQWPEMDRRRRAWFGLGDAIDRIAPAGLRRAIERLEETLRSRTAA
jgi:8-oxo-dGTP pyrophosphatase MutT (NUDIX family)